MPLNSAPGRIRTCAHGFRGPFPGIALTSRNVLAGVLTGRVSGAARRSPAVQASPVGFRLTPHDRHPGFGEARSAAFNMGGNLVAEVAVRRRAEPGWCMRSYAQTRRPTDARICLKCGRFPNRRTMHDSGSLLIGARVPGPAGVPVSHPMRGARPHEARPWREPPQACPVGAPC